MTGARGEAAAVDEGWLSGRTRAAEAAVGGFDLSECVREPIHLLGGVQSHGTLLAVDADTGIVDTAAANTDVLLGIAAADLVGSSVTRVLAPEDWAEAVETVRAGGGEAGDTGADAALPVEAGAVAGARRAFDLSVHRSDPLGPLLLLEFEPREGTDAFGFSGFYQGVRRALTRLRSATTVVAGCRAAVREVRALTGFDRVVAYRFDGAQGPGEVVAEDVVDGWEPWLGLWFPATDIPPQARRLYEENWIRVIADVDDPTVGLHPPRRAATGAPLDLSRAALRTVSGFHLEYLRNIGVRSSMSVSIIREGRLWGLIACHGAQPRRLAPEVRSACELFGAAFSLKLAAIEERERADALDGSGERAAAVAELLDADVEASLLRHEAAVRALVAADGVTLVRDRRTVSAGPVALPPALVAELGRRAATLPPGTVWATDRLPETLAGEGDPSPRPGSGTASGTDPGRGGAPTGAPHRTAVGSATAPGAGPLQGAGPDGPSASGPDRTPYDGPAGPATVGAGDGEVGPPAGVLLIPLGGAGDFLAWSRRERPMPRRWAADPAAPVRIGPRGERLTPRGSGEVIRSLMRGRSLPWTARDRAAALEMLRMLTGLVLRHAEELGTLNEQLRLSNLDLDSFAHAAAHDLKEPLRGISNAATFTLEDAANVLDATSVRRLETMQRLAGRMDELLNSLLHYARLGQTGLRRTDVSLDGVLDAALEVAGPRLAEEGVRVVRPERLPDVRADETRLYEILVNLLVNAAKYAADRPDRTVAIAVERAAVPGGGTADAIVVRDNGIGIPADRQEEVFDLFRRLHGPGEHGGGTGVGLAVVRRIVEHHGGRLWLDSAPGRGTAFLFTLGGPDQP
ncbi:ATP-binding protein [Streptomyces sp. NPDC060194]|uniref:ATP-binding protein n=1 Tax=Streptomyces sp. NPDC060194 TaxID=3347069 RepID=UPI00365A0A40